MATPAAAAPQYSLKTILKQRAFRTLWLAQFVSIFGDFLALFGVINMITFTMHGNAVQVTAVTIAYVLPLAFIGPVAGVFVDHWNPKVIMISSDVIRAGLILLLVFVSDVREICVVFAVLSTVSSFFAPAQSVTVRTLVPPEGLLAANAMIAQAFYVVRLLSPLAAVPLIVLFTEKACFYLDSLSFVFSACMIARLAIVRPARAQTEKTVRSLTQDFLAGNRFIFTHAGLAFVFIAMAVAFFVLSSFSPLVSIYIRDMLHAGTFWFGVISSMIGVGLIAGTLLVTRLVRGRSSPNVVLSGLLGLGVGAAVLGTFRYIPTAAISMFTMGFAIAFVLVPAQTMSQRETPPQMVGRVSSTFMSLISFAQILGLLLSGVLVQKLGIRPVFLAAAGFLALVAAIGYWMTHRKPQAAVAAVS
ncbi:MAG TPA: MFS transporter [Candidatus Angelobacter sp.]|nr:MFS transporter [Candidatus Angelobacter sp.]